jgi:ATP synthase F subunit
MAAGRTAGLGRLLNMACCLQIADRIRHRIDTYTQAFPTVLEIPSKDHPYDPEKDSVLRRVRRLFGE